MDLIQILILSVIEGITEFLPVSSTGHLILISKLLKIPDSNFLTSFEIFIQLGAIMAVVVLYLPKLLKNFQLWKSIFIAFIPTATAGFALYPFIKQHLLNNSTITLATLLLGGIALIFMEKFLPKISKNKSYNFHNLNPKSFFTIGIIQTLAIIPGVSRSAVTIIGGMAVGLNKNQAVEFSFLLAIPVMAAATSLDLIKSGFKFSHQEWWWLIIGFCSAFLTSIIAIKWFIKFIQNHSFTSFGIYRIILAIILAYILNN